jgi:UPF0716 protein FxsA
MPFLILLTLFVAVPIAEIAVLISVGGEIGLGSTILLVIATAMLGAWLVRNQGFQTMQRLRTEVDQGRMPAMELAEGFAILVAGALLLTPGFITDAIGFACLTPPLRKATIRWLAGKGMLASTNGPSGNTPGSNIPGGNVYDGEYRESGYTEVEYRKRD